MTKRKHTKISINALGGQGGGVLTNWIVKLGERAGYIAQMTSVPGVAQRTGATIYYVELFPEELAREKGKAPVLALTPAAGDVDIVLACELMEAGRALTRGIVTDKTTLIASSHRVYAISEKIELGDGRVDGADILAAAKDTAAVLVHADMERAAHEAGAVISAVMFGALAGSGALPIKRNLFEETIKASGRAVEQNLAGFEVGFRYAHDLESAKIKYASDDSNSITAKPDSDNHAAPEIRNLLAFLNDTFPASTHNVIYEGLKKLVDYQDVTYARTYFERLKTIRVLDRDIGGEERNWRLTYDVAKHLALWMAFEDVIRVADLKTRNSRFQRVRDEVKAGENIVHIYDFVHPRFEEVCDLAPAPLGEKLLESSFWRGVFGKFFSKGRRMPITKLRGFLLFNFLGSLKFLRRGSLRYRTENARIEDWLEIVRTIAASDYDLACEVVGMQRLIKGYGDTHARGVSNFNTIMQAMEGVLAAPHPADALAALKLAALADEEGANLNAAIARLKPPARAA